MNQVDSSAALKQLIMNNEMVLVYFSSEKCGVCNIVKRQIEGLLKDYYRIKSVEIDVDKSMKAASDFNIFTIPAVLLFIDSKEVIREARYINIQDIQSKIDRYYSLFFNNI